MKTKTYVKFLSFFLCAILIAASVLVFSGCTDKNVETNPKTTETELTQTETKEAPSDETKTVGTGSKTLHLTVVDKDKKETKFTVLTDADTAGKALLDLGLIQGEEGAYGLYIKTVDGKTLDYDTDKMYWALYVGDAYATTGIDGLEATDGLVFSLVAES